MDIFAEPRVVTDTKDCYFYHTMELPGIGKIAGNWDLNRNIRSYLGNVSFKGKRVLDVGCASGVLSFFMEEQGAEVVSFDMDKNVAWDMVPYAKWEHFHHILQERRAIIDKLNNGFWLAHRTLNSKVKAVYGSVYAIPEAIGPVDICVFGSILLHLRDPFLALQNGLKLTREKVIVSDVLRAPATAAQEPCLVFLPDAKTVEPKDTWWDVRPAWVARALGVLGFEKTTTTYHVHKYDGQDYQCYSVVGTRTHGRTA